MRPLDPVLLAALTGVLLLGLGFRVGRRARGFVFLNPDYEEFLCRQGLTDFASVQALPAMIVCGHPDRHVAQVTLGQGTTAIRAFLKREHRVRWRDRLANAWAGFGFVSKSYREALLLSRLRQAGIGCPEVLAAGEDPRGRAFVLLRELTGTQDLRFFLRDRLTSAQQRRRFAYHLGRGLARLHDAGFDQPDLYSKHVLVRPDDQEISFLDWQRSRYRRRVSWCRRCRDLAALDATLAEDLATSRDRLACLRAYLRTSGHTRKVVLQIRRHSQRLLQRRRLRELRQAPLTLGTQNLLWLDGEALCVTREFYTATGEQVPPWLTASCWPTASRQQTVHRVVPLPGGGQGCLVRRRSQQWLGRLWACLCRKTLTSPELHQAGTLFRLQRYGVVTPRLLAVGQKHSWPGRTESFLLTEPVPRTVSLFAWLKAPPRPLSEVRQVIRKTAALVRTLHEASCYLDWKSRDTDPCPLQVHPCPAEAPAVVLGSVNFVQRRHRRSEARAQHDLQTLGQQFSGAISSRTEGLRFVLAYLGLKRLTPAAKPWILRLARSRLVEPRASRLDKGGGAQRGFSP